MEDDVDASGKSSKDKIIKLARQVGDPNNWCSTCEEGGLEQTGFRATIKAKVEAVATGSAPPIVSVVEAYSSSVVDPNTLVSSLVAESPCQHFFGMAQFGERTSAPTPQPTMKATTAPTPFPTMEPTAAPVPLPTVVPTPIPTTIASTETNVPSDLPSDMPSDLPSGTPSSKPSAAPAEGSSSTVPATLNSSSTPEVGANTAPETIEFAADDSSASSVVSPVMLVVFAAAPFLV
jgi:hypothetical protein